jgi:hypothetical protein
MVHYTGVRQGELMQKISPENMQILADLSERTIYLMGGSFVLGSLFTLFLLLILDFVRHVQNERELDQ